MIAARIGIELVTDVGDRAELDQADERDRAAADAVERATICGIAVIFTLRAAGRRRSADRDAEHDQGQSPTPG